MFYLPSLIIIAFLGGLLSIASPCTGLLIPLYFAHFFKTREKFLLNSLIFFLGNYIASFFITIGIYYVFLSLPHSLSFYKVAGILFIIFGLFSLSGKNVSFPIPNIKKLSEKNLLPSLLLGIFVALSSSSCVGPVLGLIATSVARLNNIFLAGFVVLFYTIGVTFPFLLLAFGVDKFNFLKKIFVVGKEYKITIFNKIIVLHSSNILSSILFIVSGLTLVFFNGSLSKTLSFFNVDLNFMLQYQDSLINFLYK